MTINEIHIEIRRYENIAAECKRKIINFENKLSELNNIKREYLNNQQALMEFMEEQKRNAYEILNISNIKIARKYGENLSDFLRSREAEEAKKSMNQIIIDVNTALNTVDRKIESLEIEIRTCYRKIENLNERLRIEKQKEAQKKAGSLWQI